MYISRLEIPPRDRKHPEPPAPPLEVEEPFDDEFPSGRGPGSDPLPEPPLAWDYDAHRK